MPLVTCNGSAPMRLSDTPISDTQTLCNSDSVHRADDDNPPVVREERLFLNPDCGFATFATRPMNGIAIARQKMEAIVAAAERG
jgi:5-methyltetrahydropteroyltriglutamate--homocysteine methyltransferase